MMRLYFAGPLFNIAERAFNQGLAKQIEEMGYVVFLPQRDGIEKLHNGQSITSDEKRKLMFDLDRDKILESEVFLFVLDGRVPDDGACVELGIAYAAKYILDKKTQIIGLHTDSHATFLEGRLNPMVSMAFDKIFRTIEELIDYLMEMTIGENPSADGLGHSDPACHAS
jgi:nucleoside 2-deoxyribosyltransferase